MNYFFLASQDQITYYISMFSTSALSYTRCIKTVHNWKTVSKFIVSYLFLVTILSRLSEFQSITTNEIKLASLVSASVDKINEHHNSLNSRALFILTECGFLKKELRGSRNNSFLKSPLVQTPFPAAGRFYQINNYRKTKPDQ